MKFIFFKVQIPQSIAYSVLIGLPPINGLYTTFFAMMFYLIFGTSRHFSAGTEAIACLLTASAINKYQDVLFPSVSSLNETIMNNTNYLSNNIEEARSIIAMAITILVGLIQVIANYINILLYFRKKVSIFYSNYNIFSFLILLLLLLCFSRDPCLYGDVFSSRLLVLVHRLAFSWCQYT